MDVRFVKRTLKKIELFLKWGTVAGTTFVIDIMMFLALLPKIESLVALNTITFLISTVFNFYAHKFWTFRRKIFASSEVIRYLTSIFLSLLLNSIALIGLNLFVQVEISKILANITMIPINFLLMSRFTFRS